MKKNTLNRAVGIGYISACILLLLYSYTQVDLNLTLSRVGIWQQIQTWFQYIGYYNRPLSASLYVGIVAVLFGAYGTLLASIRRGFADTSFVWKLIYSVSAILLLSYPAAFSYDFFNYLFTSKTILVYHQNPYGVTPLQYAGIDPWTNFMRWTHLSSAYTPLWILLSLIPFVFGLGYFISVLFAMKAMIAGFYILACHILTRILKRSDPKLVAYGLALFALNPLILIESLVSSHNDIVLSAIALLAVFSYLQHETYRSYLFLSLSVAAKFMTIVLFPVFILRKNRAWMLGAMLGGLALVLLRREMLPWYWVWILPFVAINSEHVKVVRFAVAISVGLVLSYAPYLFFGEYSALEQVWKTSCIWVGAGIGLLSLLYPVPTRSTGVRIS